MSNKVKHFTEITALAIGAIVLASIKQSETESKVIIEIAEAIENQQVNILALANEGDSRFSPAVSIRRAWLTAEKANLSKFGITADMITAMEEAYVKDGSHLVVMLENPSIKISETKSIPLAVQIKEALKPFDDYQEANPLKTCKQAVNKKTGELLFFTKDNKLIFSKTEVVAKDQRNNQIIISDKRVSEEEAKALVEQVVSASEAINQTGA